MNTPTTGQPTTQLPPVHDDHYPGLTGARTIGTEAMHRTKDLITGAITEREMVLVYGDVGLGKTFAVHDTLRTQAPQTTIVLNLPPAATKEELQHRLWQAVGLTTDRSDTSDFHEAVLAVLRADFHVLLVDEAQLLSHYALEYLRYLWQHAHRQLAIVYVGTSDARKRLLQAAPVRSRIHDWQQFSPLTSDETATIIPVYHPVWATAPRDLILWADDLGAHGNFRNWAHATCFIHQAVTEDPNRELDKPLIRWAFSHIDPTTRFRNPL